MNEQPFDLARLDDAHRRIGAMCKNGHPPKMSIPARPEHDDDLVICNTLEDAGKEITSLRAQLAASRGRGASLQAAASEYLKVTSTRPDGSDAMTLVPANRTRKELDDAMAMLKSHLNTLSLPSDGGVGGWQPIETAPLSSKARLVWCPQYQNTFIVYWDQDDQEWKHFGGLNKPLRDHPTHWQPLPPPPTQASATSSEGGAA